MINENTPRACVVCGNDDPRVLEKDHIIPRHKHGPDSPDNLQWLCANHHRIKTPEDRQNAKQLKVCRLPDGRIQIQFNQPVSDAMARDMALAFGFNQGNALLTDGMGEVVGIECALDDWIRFVELAINAERAQETRAEILKVLGDSP